MALTCFISLNYGAVSRTYGHDIPPPCYHDRSMLPHVDNEESNI